MNSDYACNGHEILLLTLNDPSEIAKELLTAHEWSILQQNLNKQSYCGANVDLIGKEQQKPCALCLTCYVLGVLLWDNSLMLTFP